MRRRETTLIVSLLMGMIITGGTFQAQPAAHRVKVACIGNSITYGGGTQDPRTGSYPAQLQRLLGDGWEVRNFGLGGRTLLRKGDFPYWNDNLLQDARAYEPDVVIIKLGTNDSKPQNWEYKSDFVGDYEDFVDEFSGLPSHPRIYVCNPVPAFPGDWGIRDSVIRNEILPMIGSVARDRKVPVIDLYAALTGRADCFPDKVHPNEEGARLIAEAVCRAISPSTPIAVPPVAFGPAPSDRQTRWQEMEYCAFVHFGMNTFDDREWGDGTEDPHMFNPTSLDCRQWTRIFKEAGMRGVIITAKHHDGFCLWPSKHTDHSVKHSPFRNGAGDVAKELSDACREAGLKFGVYLSPWDRHEPGYGDSPRYNEHYKNQLRELLTSYGDVFEVWFDGACGEGPNGKRQVYDWPGYVDVVRECQPGAVIFSDAGPDVRWVGNEEGKAGETNWSLLRREEFYPGCGKEDELNTGQVNGTSWLPAECDVSIRPGWFYRADQDASVKSAETLFALYEASVGRNGSLLLNVPADRRGLICAADSVQLMAFKALRDRAYAHDLLEGALATASNTRGGDHRFSAGAALDGRTDTYWATDDSVRESFLTVTLGVPVEFNCAMIQEYTRLGQRVQAFSVDVWNGRIWERAAAGTTIGHKRILRFPAVKSDRIRLHIERSRANPLIASFALYGTSALRAKPGR